MTLPLTEDDLYRTSTQYRLWSFAPEGLAAQRLETHQLAIERARQYEASFANRDHAASNDGTSNEDRYLTVEEELWLVQRYCDQIRLSSDHFQWPVNVKARTCLQPKDISNDRLTEVRTF